MSRRHSNVPVWTRSTTVCRRLRPLRPTVPAGNAHPRRYVHKRKAKQVKTEKSPTFPTHRVPPSTVDNRNRCLVRCGCPSTNFVTAVYPVLPHPTTTPVRSGKGPQVPRTHGVPCARVVLEEGVLSPGSSLRRSHRERSQ